MAELLQCDICKKISPDEKGLHIANHWTEITTQHRCYKHISEKYLICDECVEKGVVIENDKVRLNHGR